jgi:protein involved in polysaccharide export with SLBB domain
MPPGRGLPIANSRSPSRKPCSFFPLRSGLGGFLAILLFAMLTQIPPAGAQQTEYKLGPQDRVRLKVYEWRSTINAVYEWSSLNAEFTVGASGSLSLPLLGEVPAAGATVSAVSRAIGEGLKNRIGLAEVPNIAVEVVEYRPFYISGAVNKPGKYPYQPDLSVLQALSVAGGLAGSGETGARLTREIIASQGDSQYSEAEANGLLARKARLEAQLQNADKIQFPPELEQRKADPAVATVMRQELAIFEAQRSAQKTEVEALEQLKVFLAKGVASLEAQVKEQQRERELTRKELEGVASLVSRGLAAAPRQLELERLASRMEGDRLRLETELLRARQDISRADISLIEARNRRTNEASANLREAQTRLEQSIVRMETAERLLRESSVTFPSLLAMRRSGGKSQPVYRIVRRVDGQTKEMTVSETAPVEPGDTLKVEIPLPEGLDQLSTGRGRGLSQ